MTEINSLPQNMNILKKERNDSMHILVRFTVIAIVICIILAIISVYIYTKKSQEISTLDKNISIKERDISRLKEDYESREAKINKYKTRKIPQYSDAPVYDVEKDKKPARQLTKRQMQMARINRPRSTMQDELDSYKQHEPDQEQETIKLQHEIRNQLERIPPRKSRHASTKRSNVEETDNEYSDDDDEYEENTNTIDDLLSSGGALTTKSN